MHNITHSRTELILEARKLHDRVTARGGVFTADDLAKLDQLDAANIQLERMAENEHRESIARRAEAISAEESETRAFRRYLRGGLGTLTENERRDLQADVAGSGGNIVAPVKITAAVLRRLNEACWVRQLASNGGKGGGVVALRGGDAATQALPAGIVQRDDLDLCAAKVDADTHAQTRTATPFTLP